MKKEKFPLSKHTDIVVQCLKDETLIYNLNTNKVFCLNQIVSSVFEHCDGQTEIHEIAEKISLELRKSVDEELVWLTIDRLKEKDLIEYPVITQTKFNGLSRREIIKKISLTSVVGLPIISSIAAPRATSAQSSGGSIGAVCSNPSQCVSNYCVSVSPASPSLCCVLGTDGYPAGEAVTSCAPAGTCSDYDFNCCSNNISEVLSPSCLAGTVICVCN